MIGDRWRDIGCAVNSKIDNSILIYNRNYSIVFDISQSIFNNFLQSLKIILKKKSY